MNYNKLLEEYNKMKKIAEKYQGKYKKFKDGYIKLNKKIGKIDKQNSFLKQEIQDLKNNHKEELSKYKLLISKYKKNGLDFATQKRVLELQKIVTVNEETIFKLKEKIKDKNLMIIQHDKQTKNIREENINIKNLLNNFQNQIKYILPTTFIDEEIQTDKTINLKDGQIQTENEEIEIKDEEIKSSEISDSDFDTGFISD